jgi:two-component system, LuxR family, sensor kinase FixL
VEEAVLRHSGVEPISKPPLSLPSAQTVLIALLGCAGYYVGALIGFALTFPASSVSTLWPPNAILLASLLLVPTGSWWLILLGAFVAHVVVQLQSGVPILMILCWFISNSTEALIGALCLRHFLKGPLDLASLKNLIFYVGFAAVLAPFLSSFLDAAFVTLVGWKQNSYWQVWMTRFPSNVLAAIAIPPFIVLWCSKGIAWLRRASQRQHAEGLLLIGGLMVVGFFAFVRESPDLQTTPVLLYLPLPFLLWAAMRFGSLGSSSALLLVVLTSIWGVAQGRGPFAQSSPAENVFSLQMFLIAISLPIMFLAGLVEERREKAEALSESEARFRSMADTAPVLIWMSGTDKLCYYFNKPWLEFTGRTLEQEMGNGWAESVHLEDLQRCLDTYVQAFDARQPFVMEYRLRRRDGEYRWVVDNGVPRYGPGGSFSGYIGSCLDITERRQAEERFRLAVEASPSAIVMMNQQGRIVLVNVQTEKLFGYSREELIGHYVEMLVPELFRTGYPPYRAEFLTTPQGREMGAGRDLFGRRKDGSVFMVEVGLNPIHTNEGVLVLTAVVDITERKRAEAELQLQREELAHLTRVATMGELAASLAHELNQPLTAILSNAQAAQRFLAAKPANLEEVREILKDIVQDNQRAGEVIRRLRAFLKKEDPAFAPLDLEGLIRDVVTLVHSDAVLHNVRVLLEFSDGLPSVQGDRVQLQQVVVNLLLNAFDAMKDFPASEREVSMQAKLDGEMIEVSVRDRGTGLTTDKVDKIFQSFYTTKREGLGMGLSISRSIIDAHGGRLWAENNPDRGATFYFTMPIAESRGKIRTA